ncbi:MAG: DUF732 domain-containing protein [Mycobacterium sp.]
MKFPPIATAALSAALLAGAAVGAPTAQADPGADAFLSALAGAGITGIDPATAVSVGQQVCPMLSEPGQRMADVAADVSSAIGRPLGPATMFTGLAITLFCPGAVAAVGDRIANPVILPMLGF